ncbi:hypothetical protein [Mitsuaria sp. 7]|uniref:hypothetical protein n=1 Tax=Mitsuaria sp. 7 TaxID=1658665 RepID=UPI000A639C87|nr:hypothetical protein [Mitsuaria sp. 7]
MSPILSQIARLTKSIYTGHADSDTSNQPSAQFFAGRKTGDPFRSRIGLSWRYGKDTNSALRNLSRLLVRSDAQYKNFDKRTMRASLTETLQEICLEKSIFDTDLLMFGGARSLFQCRSIQTPVPQFLSRIETEFRNTMNSKLGRFCTIHSLPRVVGINLDLAQFQIKIIDIASAEDWQHVLGAGYATGGWTPLNPHINGRTDSTFSPPNTTKSLFISEDDGTAAGCKSEAEIKFRCLAAVLYAVYCENVEFPPMRATADASTFCVQFPHQSNFERSYLRSQIRPILPFFGAPMVISNIMTQEIQIWYQALAECDTQSHARIQKGAHFFNLALNDQGIQAFVNYFVALDAIFGVRGSVERSILDGIASLGLGPQIGQKTAWLFELRNELVHGGSRRVEEWPRYERYCEHFDTEPMDDMATIARMVIRRASRVFSRRQPAPVP